MKKAPLYSRSRPVSRASTDDAPSDATSSVGSGSAGAASTTIGGVGSATRWQRIKGSVARHERQWWASLVLLLVVGALVVNGTMKQAKAPLTIQQIDAAMRKSIEEKPLAAPTSAAYDAILPSVVRVVGLMTEGDDGSDKMEADSEKAEKPPAKGTDTKTAHAKDADKHATKDGKVHAPIERGIGTGVVIIDNGTILTNYHVINGAKRIRVTFMDGTESEAFVQSAQPENDLAVLRAKTIPDDLAAATMRSTADLSPGDQVLAVGFPFGIGPSASAGIVSGLKREFRSPEGKQTLTNLIQFDAAANPGNSGGPLVTMDGAVVGIVTAILNPSQQRTFIGIGFAVPIENAAAAAGMPPF
jgi:serine protease DegQ